MVLTENYKTAAKSCDSTGPGWSLGNARIWFATKIKMLINYVKSFVIKQTKECVALISALYD